MRSKGRINNYVGHRLREIRTGKNLTSQEVARRAGIAPGSYSCLENGWYKINLDNLFRILHVLKADVNEVWPQVDLEPATGIDDKYLEQVTRRALEEEPRDISLDDVFAAVCRAFEVSKDKLLSRSRWLRLEEARGACGILAREFPPLSLTALSRMLGYSVSSMSQLVRQSSQLLSEDQTFSGKVDRARQELKKRFNSNSH